MKLKAYQIVKFNDGKVMGVFSANSKEDTLNCVDESGNLLSLSLSGTIKDRTWEVLTEKDSYMETLSSMHEYV